MNGRRMSTAGEKVKNRNTAEKIENVGMRPTILFTWDNCHMKHGWEIELTLAL